jgi:hypothetical protein
MKNPPSSPQMDVECENPAISPTSTFTRQQPVAGAHSGLPFRALPSVIPMTQNMMHQALQEDFQCVGTARRSSDTLLHNWNFLRQQQQQKQDEQDEQVKEQPKAISGKRCSLLDMHIAAAAQSAGRAVAGAPREQKELLSAAPLAAKAASQELVLLTHNPAQQAPRQQQRDVLDVLLGPLYASTRVPPHKPAQANVQQQHSTTAQYTKSTRCRWLAVDAETDAAAEQLVLEVSRIAQLPAAALVLQCAWRARVPRLWLGRYLQLRQRSVAAVLQPSLSRWHAWSSAGAQNRRTLLRWTFLPWLELSRLQLQLCIVVRCLQLAAWTFAGREGRAVVLLAPTTKQYGALML